MILLHFVCDDEDDINAALLGDPNAKASWALESRTTAAYKSGRGILIEMFRAPTALWDLVCCISGACRFGGCVVGWLVEYLDSGSIERGAGRSE
jgi:hypothetical protein